MKRLYVLIVASSIILNVLFFAYGDTWSAVRGSLSNDYSLLSPRIFASHKNDIIVNFTALRQELNVLMAQPRGFEAGVYFEYLPSGVSIGVNEKTEFISASLLKVPFIMGIYQEIEAGRLDAEKQLTLEETDLDQRFGQLWKRGAGTHVSVEEAIRLSLTHSDNTAINVLNRELRHNVLKDVHDALDITIQLSGDTTPVVSAKNYSSIFRCLYLSCYLPYECSQKILSLLTESIFSNGIQAGVPPHVPVAHKVGIYDAPNHNGGVRSDCGIIYEPSRPYVLCIIVSGDKSQEDLMITFMQNISERVYTFVHNL